MNIKPFGEVFLERIDRIEAEAKKVGLNLTAICREAGISRATPDRWRAKPPKTIEIIELMEKIVKDRRAELDRNKGLKGDEEK